MAGATMDKVVSLCKRRGFLFQGSARPKTRRFSRSAGRSENDGLDRLRDRVVSRAVGGLRGLHDGRWMLGLTGKGRRRQGGRRGHPTGTIQQEGQFQPGSFTLEAALLPAMVSGLPRP